jgi:hypothetical protein
MEPNDLLVRRSLGFEFRNIPSSRERAATGPLDNNAARCLVSGKSVQMEF